jgi:predicted O-linked N-acetylglucosamine transferase (SPINDLY family)
MNVLASPRPANDIEAHRRAVRLNPRDANAHALLGIALLRVRELAEGVAGLRRALELNPKVKGVHAILAAALFEMDDHDAAAGAYRQALRFQDAADLHQGLADSLRLLGRIDEAEPSARRAVALAPDNAAAHLCLAAVLHRQRRLDDTAAVLRRALELDPANLDVRYDLAGLDQKLHRYVEAVDNFRLVLDSRPDHFDAHRLMGTCFRSLRRYEEAHACLERAAALQPDNADVLCDLGATLQMLGRLPQAVALLERALALDPDNIYVLRALAHAKFTLGEWEQAVDTARRLLELEQTPYTHSMVLFMLSHCCLDGAELTREHFAYGARWDQPAGTPRQPHGNERDPQRQLRVGLVTADLYGHAVSRFITPVLEAMADSEQVQFHVYYNNTIEDAITQTNRSHVAGWHAIVNLDDAQADALIRSHGIDILIDLSGHSALNRLPLFALRPAPVQATWIGYAGTTGMAEMDYILCDRYLVPDARYDAQFSEQIVRLPLGAPFLPEPGAPDVNDLPALKNGYLTFGSFHRASKLSRGVIGQWARLLHAVPDAKMLLGGLQDGIDDVLVDWFAAEGIPRERLLLRQRTTVREYMAQHYDVDVCLCPFPYTGATTIGNALWMGVPTLATVGDTNPSQAATTFMAHLGLSTFITEDEDTYVKLGVFLSQNVSALAAMRASMRERFLKSVLGYPGVAAAGLELGLRRMWQRWCAGEAPAPIRVTLSDLVPASSEEVA